MKLERENKEVIIRLSFEEARELKDSLSDLDLLEAYHDTALNIHEELNELFGENNE